MVGVEGFVAFMAVGLLVVVDVVPIVPVHELHIVVEAHRLILKVRQLLNEPCDTTLPIWELYHLLNWGKVETM